MAELDRKALAAQAETRTAELAALGVELVALTFVDNSGVTRTKAVPLRRLAAVAAWGVGASHSFDFFGAHDGIAGGEYSTGPVGDLRLHPVLERLTVLGAQPGWAWAPAERYDQDGVVHPMDQRSLAGRVTRRLAEAGFTVRLAFEIEWILTAESAPDDPGAAVSGPAYGFARLSQHADYLRDLVSVVDGQGVEVEQIHPEFAPGQFELSVAPADPVHAADTAVLVRETIRAVSRRHGLRASFTPKFAADGVGNGGHVHLSLWDGAGNTCAGGDGPFGLRAAGQSFGAGILDRLPALLTLGAPSVVSYLRLVPQHWAGAFAVWGLENREAALRLVRGAAGERDRAANFEVKCFDATANPYLLVAGLLAAGLAGVRAAATLPAPVHVDPATLSTVEHAAPGVRRLPTTLSEAVAEFEQDAVLGEAFGPALSRTLVELRRAEIARFAGKSAAEITAAFRWTH